MSAPVPYAVGQWFVIDEAIRPTCNLGCLSSFDTSLQGFSSQKSNTATANKLVNELCEAIKGHADATDLDVKATACFNSSFNTGGILALYSAFVAEVTDEVKRLSKRDLVQVIVDHRVPFMTWNAFDDHVRAIMLLDEEGKDRPPCGWTDAWAEFVTVSEFKAPVAADEPAPKKPVPRSEPKSAGFIIGKTKGPVAQPPKRTPLPCFLTECGALARVRCGDCTKAFCAVHEQAKDHECDAFLLFESEGEGPDTIESDVEGEPLSKLKRKLDARRPSSGGQLSLDKLTTALNGFADRLSQGRPQAHPSGTPSSITAYNQFLANTKALLTANEFVNPCALAPERMEKLKQLPRRLDAESTVSLFGGVGEVSLSVGKTESSVPIVRSLTTFFSGFRALVGIIATIPARNHQVQDRLEWCGWLESSCHIVDQAAKLEFALQFTLDNLKSDSWMQILHQSGLKHISYLLPSAIRARDTPGASLAVERKLKANADKRAAESKRKLQKRQAGQASQPAAPTVVKVCLSRTKDLGAGPCRFGASCKFLHACPHPLCNGADHTYHDCPNSFK
jgi:hypothetical protein